METYRVGKKDLSRTIVDRVIRIIKKRNNLKLVPRSVNNKEWYSSSKTEF